MTTLGTMRTRIAREMRRGDLTASSTAIAAAVLSAIQFYENERFFFTEFHENTVTASASVSYVALTVLSVRPVTLDSVKAVIGQRDYPLLERNWSELERIDSGQWYGYPDYYALHGEEIRLYPPPNSNYTLKVSGVKTLPEISVSASASATNAWMTDGEEMIRLKAKALLFRDEVRAPEQAAQFEAAAALSRRAVKRRTTSLAASGRITPRW